MLSHHFYSLNKFTIFFEKMFHLSFWTKKIEPAFEDPIISFVKSRHERLTKTYSDELRNYSSNIDPAFYSKKELQEIMNNEHNYLENQWKTRILIDSTPRGNIIMFYDVYKQGFAYYSDQNSIPYTILNAVAMKYVLFFGCRDFFVDAYFLPKDYISPLAKIMFEDEKDKKKDKKDKKDMDSNKKPIDINNGPFAKLKNYRLEEKKEPKIYYNALYHGKHTFVTLGFIMGYNLFRLTTMYTRHIYYLFFKKPEVKPLLENKKTENIVKDKYFNKFINLGKTYNFSILQKNSMVPTSSVTKYDNFFSDNNSRKGAVSLDHSLTHHSLPVFGTVISKDDRRSSAVSKNTKNSMTWHDYKNKLNENTQSLQVF